MIDAYEVILVSKCMYSEILLIGTWPCDQTKWSVYKGFRHIGVTCSYIGINRFETTGQLFGVEGILI